MPRLVEFHDKKPVKLQFGGESKWICMCGLSCRKPYCDGSHKQTTDELENKTYIYKDGVRSEVE